MRQLKLKSFLVLKIFRGVGQLTLEFPPDVSYAWKAL